MRLTAPNSLWAVDLPPAPLRTFRYHFAYAMLDAAVGGVVLTAPGIAIKMMHAPTWQLYFREAFSGIGMVAALFLGGWMARRPKMPFVVIPGVLCALSTLAMPFVMGDSLTFLLFFSAGAMFEIVTRPAITAVLRFNYPATDRGAATGKVRAWSSIVFVVAMLSTGAILSAGGVQVIQGALLAAGLLGLAAFASFRQIDVREPPVDAPSNDGMTRPFVEAWTIIRADARYRRYLAACIADGFLLYLFWPGLLWVLFKDLGYGLALAPAMLHVVPAVVAFFVTGLVGRWLDRTNPWWGWAWIRFAWGADALLLAATPLVALSYPPAVLLLPLLGRVLRGATQGAQWILMWQIGVTHFAPPGADTSRYMGIMVFISGAVRMAASAAGIALAANHVPPTAIIAVGGLGFIAVGFYSLWQGFIERREARLATIADFEAQFEPQPIDAREDEAMVRNR